MFHIIMIMMSFLAQYYASVSTLGALFGHSCTGEASDAVLANNFEGNYAKVCMSDMHLTCDAKARQCVCKDEYYPDFITGENPDGSVCRYVDPQILDIEDEDEINEEQEETNNAQHDRFNIYITVIVLVWTSFYSYFLFLLSSISHI